MALVYEEKKRHPSIAKQMQDQKSKCKTTMRNKHTSAIKSRTSGLVDARYTAVVILNVVAQSLCAYEILPCIRLLSAPAHIQIVFV